MKLARVKTFQSQSQSFVFNTDSSPKIIADINLLSEFKTPTLKGSRILMLFGAQVHFLAAFESLISQNGAHFECNFQIASWTLQDGLSLY